MKIIIALLIFSIIIIFHELGHFSLAKANGIRVNEFCLGLGPTILGVTKGETKYSLKLLPFGGACMMEGEDGESTDDRAFGKKSVWARISVVAAGPVCSGTGRYAGGGCHCKNERKTYSFLPGSQFLLHVPCGGDRGSDL